MKLKINYYLHLFFGISIITLFAWSRLFRNKTILDLANVYEITLVSKILYVIGFLLNFLLLCITIKKLCKISNLGKTFDHVFLIKKFKDFLFIIQNYYNNILIVTFETLFYNMPLSWNTGNKLQKFLFSLYIKYFITPIKLKTFYFILKGAPKIILAMAFVYGVIQDKNLSLFIKLLPLGFMPLLHDISFYGVKNFIDNSIKDLQQYLDFDLQNAQYTHEFEIKPKVDFASKELFDTYANLLGEIICILHLQNRYKNVTTNITLYISFIVHITFVICWLIVLTYFF